MIKEEVGVTDADKAMFKAVAEETAVGEAGEKVSEDITIIKWRGTIILTSWQNQRFMILMFKSHSIYNRGGK